MTDNKLIYVYCATGHKPELSIETEAGNMISLCFGDLYAVARYVSPDEFSEENLKKNFADLAWVEEKSREHIRVISLEMEQGTVVPFKLGTVYKTSESLGSFLKEHYETLSNILKSLAGKEEWAIKLFCNNELFQQHIRVVSNEINKLEAEMQDSKPGRAFIIKRQLAELTREETHKQLRNYGQLFFEQISKLCVKTLTCPLLPREVTERTDDMVLNLACLVDKGNAELLVKKVEVLGQEYARAGLLPEISGPWPAFSFIK